MDIDFFIKFYEEIPEEKWCVGQFENNNGQSCAIGLLGVRQQGGLFNYIKTELFESFCKVVPSEQNIFMNGLYPNCVSSVNNGLISRYQQKTPKERVLAYLNDIKNKQHETI